MLTNLDKKRAIKASELPSAAVGGASRMAAVTSAADSGGLTPPAHLTSAPIAGVQRLPSDEEIAPSWCPCIGKDPGSERQVDGTFGICCFEVDGGAWS